MSLATKTLQSVPICQLLAGWGEGCWHTSSRVNTSPPGCWLMFTHDQRDCASTDAQPHSGCRVSLSSQNRLNLMGADAFGTVSFDLVECSTASQGNTRCGCCLLDRRRYRLLIFHIPDPCAERKTLKPSTLQGYMGFVSERPAVRASPQKIHPRSCSEMQESAAATAWISATKRCKLAPARQVPCQPCQATTTSNYRAYDSRKTFANVAQ